jgi:hypothetical protein
MRKSLRRSFVLWMPKLGESGSPMWSELGRHDNELAIMIGREMMVVLEESW